MEALAVLALLACPVGMGLMMWLMGRGMKKDEAGRPPVAPPSLEQLREEQARLAARIEERERSESPAEPGR